MPSIASKSKIRASSEDWSLALVIQHLLVVGLPSDTVQQMKTSLPNHVEVHLDAQLRVTVSGVLNGDKVSPPVLQESCIARHLVEYLRLNATELGIAVSDIQISGDTGLSTFICTSSRPFRPAHDEAPLRTTLVGLNLTYIWRTTSGLADDHVMFPEIVASMNPFSRKQLSLPFLTAVNSIVQKFVTFQLVKRYPLIFGPWAQQLDVEVPYTASIHKSLNYIISRSPHPKFQLLCKRLSKLSMKQVALGSLSVAGKFSDYLGMAEPTNAPLFFDEHDVSMAMTNFYKLGLRRPLFKGISLSQTTEDQDENLFDDSSDQNVIDNCDGQSYSETHRTSASPHLEINFDLEDISGYSSDGDSQDYPPFSLSWDAKTSWRNTDPELGILEPNDSSFNGTVDCCDESENEINARTKSRKSSSDDQRHKLSTAYPGWSADIDSSQEKLDRFPVGMPITHTLHGPRLIEKSPVALDSTCFECCAEPPDKELPENFNDSDFEDWSGPQKNYTFEFGTSTLQFDSDSGSSSTASDGHEIIAFEGMGSQRLTPLSPRHSISSEEPTGLGAVLMDFGGDKGGCSDRGGVTTTSEDDHGFLVIDFE